MSDTTRTKGSRATSAALKTETPESPKSDLPNVMSPALVREWAEKGVSQAKDSYEKMRTAAEEATELLEGSFETASRGTTEYGARLVEMMRANANAGFDLARDLLGAKSFSEIIEVSTAHARKQFDTYSAQTKELAALAQKVAADTSEPVKASVSKAFEKTRR